MKTLSRRHFGDTSLATLVAVAWSLGALDQRAAGNRKTMVGYPAGGTLDQPTRRVTEA